MNTADKPFTVLCAELRAILTDTKHIEPWEEEKSGKHAVDLYLKHIVVPAEKKTEEMNKLYQKAYWMVQRSCEKNTALTIKLKQIGGLANE